MYKGRKINMIVAVDSKNGIGKDNKLLIYIPEDLTRFKEITSGHNIIMGRNTFLSLPKGALPNRKNIVLTFDKTDKFDGAYMAYSLDEAIDFCDEDKKIFIIGGASIYEQMFDYTDYFYITSIHKEFEADTFFPEVEKNMDNIMYARQFIHETKSGEIITYSFYEITK